MWLMVLKPGGLITSTAGKAIFISGFTAAGFAVYVSHYTRTYGIIGCASFAGATAIVLGIDCFSRAGLKEFWLYIWSKPMILRFSIRAGIVRLTAVIDLNNALLPPHYNDPYPITRGIRVEIAGIVLLCAIGIMSQMKVWNIVKKRREDRAAAKNLERQRQDEAEEELGRKLEEGKERERITWEAVYGGNGQKRGQHIDSGIGTDEPGSIRKGSTSVRTVEMPRSGDASIEMNRLGPGKGSSTQGPREGRQDGRVTVRVASGDEIFALPPIDFGEFRDTLSWKGETAQASKPPSISKSPPEEPRKESPEVQVTEVSVPVVSEAAERLSKMPAAEVSKPDTIEEVERPGEPQIIPLPFRIPDADMENDNDGSSVATFAASDRRFSRMSKRMSGASLLMSPSKRSESHSWGVSNASEEALMIPYVDDDKASSLAATVDGVSDRDSDDDIDSRSRRVSELDNAHKETLPDQSMPATEIGGDWFQSNGSDQTDNIDGKPSSGAGEAPGMSSAPLLELPKQDQEHHVRDLSESPSRELSSGEGPLMGEHTKSATESNALGKRPMRTLSGRLPDDASKVVMAYRTNEWAKHLEQADLPKLDELNEPINVPAEAVAAKEAPVPVLVEELQQTPLTAEPLPVINATKMGARERLSKAALSRLHLSKTQSPYQNAAQQPKDPNRPSNSGNGARPPLLQQQPSESLQSQDRPPQPAPGQSQLSLNTNRNHRSSSTPLTSQPFAESPIEEDVEASFPPRFTPSPMHLMSKRDKLVRNKPSSTSLLKFDSTPNPTPPLHSSASDSSSLHGGVGDMDQDNIPLSHRKSLLRAQKRSSAPLQPCRSSSTPLQNARDSTIAAWRSTLQPSSNSPLTHAHLQNQTQGVSLEKRREELLREKRRASASAAVNEKAKGMRESVLEQGMRRGDMLEAHREAMRRMQAGANRRL